jgi:predicted O-linked N-acetylglucosamine transferase (SPINDLY family)
MTLQQQFESGISRHRAGRLDEAAKIYREVLAQQPDHADALHLLGLLEAQAGRPDEAVELFQRAISICSTNPFYFRNLGDALQRKEQLDAAIAAYGHAIRLKPDLVNAHNNRGNALMAKGLVDEAIAAYQDAIRMKPDYAEAHYNLGNALQRQRQLDPAIAAYGQAIRIQPDYADAHNNLGIALATKGRMDEAIAVYQRAIQIKPDYAETQYNLGNALQYTGQLDAAIAAFGQAIRLKPDNIDAYNNLGNALRSIGQLEESVAAYRHAIRIKPDCAEAHSNLGLALKDTGQLDDAIAACRQAIRLKADFSEAYNNLGFALMDTGRLDEAIAAYRQAIRLKPDNIAAHDNLVFTVHFHPGSDGKTIREELRQWNDRHAEPLRKLIQPHNNNRDPDRRLRIGYVSADFLQHAVGRNLLPLLREHDHRQMEIFCYSDVARPDALTDQLRQHTDAWRSIVGMPDSQAADLIRGDRIDILVDLALYSAKNRLLMFAHKPAPVQVTYLGYCSSSGMNAMDYRKSDPYLDPSDSDLSVYSERTIRLAETYWCYGVTDPTPEPSPPPAAAMGYITFGCLNHFAKASPPALDLWAEILRILPTSRLIVHSQAGTHLDAVRERFAVHDVSPDRLEFLGRQPRPQYLQTYSRIDIALDPFPWGGGITTCDALWMGVPVVSLVGQTAVGRGGASILANIGLPELIARTPEQYIQIATDLARDLPRLVELRRTLRARTQGSPLMDAPRFARNVEAAYHQMWRTWCERSEVSGLQCPPK